MTHGEGSSHAEAIRLDWKVLGSAMGCFLAINYVLCVGYDLFGAQMYRAWFVLLPGFRWLSRGSFLLGLIETIAYGVFLGLVFAAPLQLLPREGVEAHFMTGRPPAAAMIRLLGPLLAPAMRRHLLHSFAIGDEP